MRIVAVIPVKHNSDRVHSKNFREFTDGKSIFRIKLDQLVNSGIFDQIYVSSDSPDAETECLGLEKVTFLERAEEFCNNIISWSDVIYHVVNGLPEDDAHVAWVHTTSPLFERFEEAVNAYKEALKNGENGLVTVSRFREFLVNDKKQPYNYCWGPWHPYSQNLDTLYAITGALFVAHRNEMLKNRYVISTNPHWFEVTDYEAIDLDTEFDFKVAQLMWQNKSELLNA